MKGKTSVFYNLMKHERRDIEKIYLYAIIHLNQSINYLLMKEKK